MRQKDEAGGRQVGPAHEEHAITTKKKETMKHRLANITRGVAQVVKEWIKGERST